MEDVKGRKTTVYNFAFIYGMPRGAIGNLFESPTDEFGLEKRGASKLLSFADVAQISVAPDHRFRRLSKDFELLTASSEAFILIAASRLLISPFAA